MKNNLLIVDDDASVCEGLKVVLELQDYEVRTSDDAAEAVRTVSARPPALVVMDFNMPGMTGSQAIELIRALPNDLPIIGISAELHREQEMRDAGVSTFLPKPLDMARFTRTVGELITSSQAA